MTLTSISKKHPWRLSQGGGGDDLTSRLSVQIRTLPLVPSTDGPHPARGDSGVCMCIHVCLVWSVFPTAFIVPQLLSVYRQLHTNSPARIDSIWTWRNAHEVRRFLPQQGSNSRPQISSPVLYQLSYSVLLSLRFSLYNEPLYNGPCLMPSAYTINAPLHIGFPVYNGQSCMPRYCFPLELRPHSNFGDFRSWLIITGYDVIFPYFWHQDSQFDNFLHWSKNMKIVTSMKKFSRSLNTCVMFVYFFSYNPALKFRFVPIAAKIG